MKQVTFGELRVGDYFALVGVVSIEQVIDGQYYTSKQVFPPPEVRLCNTDDQAVLAFDDYAEANEWYFREVENFVIKK